MALVGPPLDHRRCAHGGLRVALDLPFEVRKRPVDQEIVGVEEDDVLGLDVVEAEVARGTLADARGRSQYRDPVEVGKRLGGSVVDDDHGHIGILAADALDGVRQGVDVRRVPHRDHDADARAGTRHEMCSSTSRGTPSAAFGARRRVSSAKRSPAHGSSPSSQACARNSAPGAVTPTITSRGSP
jgi:hypothetical protein